MIPMKVEEAQNYRAAEACWLLLSNHLQKSIIQDVISSCVTGSVRPCRNINGLESIHQGKSTRNRLLLHSILQDDRADFKSKDFTVYWFADIGIHLEQ